MDFWSFALQLFRFTCWNGIISAQARGALFYPGEKDPQAKNN